jgi:hypothetical protein
LLDVIRDLFHSVRIVSLKKYIKLWTLKLNQHGSLSFCELTTYLYLSDNVVWGVFGDFGLITGDVEDGHFVFRVDDSNCDSRGGQPGIWSTIPGGYYERVELKEE